jgi:hypothetical protein
MFRLFALHIDETKARERNLEKSRRSMPVYDFKRQLNAAAVPGE